jgi:hypothetical protein
MLDLFHIVASIYFCDKNWNRNWQDRKARYSFEDKSRPITDGY